MSKLSGIRDVDREIFSKLDDYNLLKACSIDKYTWNTVCDDAFLKRRLLAKYPEIEKYKEEEETWKEFFLLAIHYIAKMKEKFGYVYTSGDFIKQYKLLKTYKFYNDDKDNLLINSADDGELSLAIWSIKIGADIHINNDLALIAASRNGHLEVVKYLVENGANINAQNGEALKEAIRNGHLKVVNYLKTKM